MWKCEAYWIQTWRMARVGLWVVILLSDGTFRDSV